MTLSSLYIYFIGDFKEKILLVAPVMSVVVVLYSFCDIDLST